MPNFGSYQTDRVTGRRADGSLHTLPDPSQCLLAFEPPADLLSPVRLHAAQSNFIARFDLQRTVAEGSTRWAKVFDLEPLEPSGAFCVMERLDWPLVRLIRLRVTPSPADLYRLVTEVLEALRDAQNLVGRSHGNLRAENIFASSGTLAEARIVLVAPRASVFNSTKAASDDLAQLGRIICELVASRRWTPTTPLDPGMAEFRQLGAIGRRWTEFCRFLLNTDIHADQRSIFSALTMAAKLKPRKSRAPMGIGITAALMLIAAVVAGYIHHRRTLEEMSRFNGAYSAYNTAWHGWFKAFTQNKKLLASVPEFSQVSAALKGGIVLSPNNILHEFTGLLSPAQIQKDLASHPHEAQRLGLAVVLLMRTERILGNIHGKLIHQQNQWNSRGWRRASADLYARGAAPILPDQSMVPFLRLHSAAWAVNPDLRKLQLTPDGVSAAQWFRQIAAAGQVSGIWSQLSPVLKSFAADSHRSVASFDPYASRYLASASTPDILLMRQRQLLRVARRQATALARYGGSIRWDLVAALPPRNMQLPPDKYFPNLADYRVLAGNDNAYLRLKPQFTADAALVRSGIAHAMRLPKPPTVNYLAGLRVAERNFSRLSDHNLWIWKNRAILDKQAQSAIQRVQNLHQSVTAFINSQINVRKWVAQLLGLHLASQNYPVNPNALVISTIPAINAAYLAKVRRILFAPAPPPAMALEANVQSYNLLVSSLRPRRWRIPILTARITAVRNALTHILRKDFPAGLSDSAAQLSRPWNQQLLQAAILPARASAVRQAMRTLHWNDLTPQIQSSAVQSWLSRHKAFESLVINFNRIQDALNECRLLNGSLPGGGSIARLYAQARANIWWTNAATARALAPQIALLRRLEQIHSAAIPALSVAWNRIIAAHPVQPLLIRAIWQRLGLVAPQPTANLMNLEHSLPDRLKAAIAADSQISAARKAALQHLLADQYHLRWQQRMNAAVGASQVNRTIVAAADYQITLSKAPGLTEFSTLSELRPRAQLNILVRQFAAGAQGITTPAGARAAAAHMQEVLTGAFSRPGWAKLSSSPRLIQFQGALEGILKANPAQARQPAGPALAGWKQQKLPNHARLFTSPSGHRKLTFVLLTPLGHKRFYLCTTELSVGIFLSVLNSSSSLIHRPSNSFYNLIKPNGNYFGPHTWVYHQSVGQVEMAKSWFTNTNQIYNAPRYSSALQAADGKRLSPAAGGPPRSDDPVNYLPPQAAVYVAALLGCRLPTSAEWRYAWREKGSGSRPHLAGKTLAGYVQYLKRVNSSKDARLPTPRYWDLYNYSAPDMAASLHSYGPSANPILWFEPVSGAARSPAFIHLTGNVAEWVFDDTHAYSKAFKGWIKMPKALNSAVVQSLFTPAALKMVYVIGGSCLSPLGKTAPDKPIPINWHLRRTRRGFADVGMRLAYQPRVLTPQERLAQLIGGDWYF